MYSNASLSSFLAVVINQILRFFSGGDVDHITKLNILINNGLQYLHVQMDTL